MKLLSIDFGTKNIGLAIGQYITNTASVLNDIHYTVKTNNFNRLFKIICFWNPKIIILGLPLNINSTEQDITNKVKIFAFYLYNKINIKVILYDERLSTFEIRYLKCIKKKNILHSFSAVIILESWFNFNFNKIY